MRRSPNFEAGTAPTCDNSDSGTQRHSTLRLHQRLVDSLCSFCSFCPISSAFRARGCCSFAFRASPSGPRHRRFVLAPVSPNTQHEHRRSRATTPKVRNGIFPTIPSLFPPPSPDLSSSADA
ncbi:hypothetical protein EJ04DRAFT_195838 [Polyplosphaeria fusca]|uniref:Uncharacterized protein n=1 Tax=Polyplosphaeria fusca TaxID=682080 RepID=A0A9P4QZT5_9PLEO|nr:hypothetical protein EJ04DRAFT_195838 [Polyplosphaeria fusca]